MTQRTIRRLAWSNAALSVVFVTTGLVLSLVALGSGESGAHWAPHQFFNPVITLTFPIVGALIAVRHPRNPIGWMLAATGFLSSLSLLALGTSMYSQARMTSISPQAADFARWLSAWVWLPEVMIPTTFVLLIFPDGRLLSPRWRLIAWLAALGLAAGVLAYALDPSLDESGGTLRAEPPLFAPAAQFLESVAWPLLGVGFLGSLASLVVRFRRSHDRERDQLKWPIYAVVLVLAIGVVLGGTLAALGQAQLVMGELGILWSGLIVTSIIVGVGIAIVRHRLYDIDILINRTLVYSGLTALVVATYILVVGSLGALFQSRGILPTSLFATAVVAVGFEPMRARLQRAVNRLMYGERDDPYAVLQRLGDRLQEAAAPDGVLATVVETVAQSLKLPFAAISIGGADDASTAATYGRPVAQPERFPLVFQAETIGQLLVGRRTSGEEFTPAEKRLLANIAYQAGAAVHAAQLTADLQRSRVRLVTTREEERRRLRRDLHDGLGPILASQGLKLAAARQLLGTDRTSVAALLDQLIDQNETSVAEIRRLVYDLRPAALDDRGLVEAVRDHVAGLEGKSAASGGPQVRVESLPPDLPPLPAAVEVAAYRIALEALTNVLRHAHARHCTIGFTLESREPNTLLRVEVSDDGVGLPGSPREGVGLRSMRERAEELGGTLTHRSAKGGGTRVSAELPLPGVP